MQDAVIQLSIHGTLTHAIFTCNQLLTDCLTTLGFILRRVHILLTGFKMSKPHLGWWLCITVVFLDTLQDRYLCHTLFSDLHAWPCRLHLPHSCGSSLLHLFAQPSLVKSPSLVCSTFTGQVSFTCLLDLHWSSLLHLFARPSLVKSIPTRSIWYCLHRLEQSRDSHLHLALAPYPLMGSRHLLQL